MKSTLPSHYLKVLKFGTVSVCLVTQVSVTVVTVRNETKQNIIIEKIVEMRRNETSF